MVGILGLPELLANAGQGLGMLPKFRQRADLLALGRSSDSGARLGALLLSKFRELASGLQYFDLVDGLFGRVLFVPAGDFG